MIRIDINLHEVVIRNKLEWIEVYVNVYLFGIKVRSKRKTFDNVYNLVKEKK